MNKLSFKDSKDFYAKMQYWIFQFDEYSQRLKEELEEDYLSSSFQDVIKQLQEKKQ